MRALVALGLLLGACTAQQIGTAQTDADNAVAQAQPTIAMACWLAQAADAGFQVYAAGATADPAVVANEKTAMAAATAICANPPANVAQAIADVMAAYKSVVAATPAAAGS
jgi:hypothetical protein